MGGGVIGKMDGFFANIKQEIRIARDGRAEEGGTHGTVSHPCPGPACLPPRLGPARDDVM